MESRHATAAAAAAPVPPPYPPALVSLPSLARPPSSMTMPELEVVAAALPAKKRRLRETFDRLAASAPAPLPLRWEDLEAYISSLQYSVTLRFRELRAHENSRSAPAPAGTSPPAATGGDAVVVGKKRTAADEAMRMHETQEKTQKVNANAAAAIEKAPLIQGLDANGKKFSRGPPGCGNDVAVARTRTDATVQVDPIGQIAVVRHERNLPAATRHAVNATNLVKASGPNSTSLGQDSRPVPAAVAVSAPAVTGGSVKEMREVKEDSAAPKNHSNEGGEVSPSPFASGGVNALASTPISASNFVKARATNGSSVLPAKVPKQEEPTEEVDDVEMEIVDAAQKIDEGKSEVADVEMEIVDFAQKIDEGKREEVTNVETKTLDAGQNVNEGKSKTIKKFKKPKPVFKKLLAKYENGKAGQKVTSRPKNFKRPRSPPKQGLDGRDRRHESFHAAPMYHPFGPPIPVIWGPPPPPWGWYGPMMPPPMHFGHFDPGWTAPRMSVFGRQSRPKDSRFDQRSRSYDGKGNKAVKKVYLVKESSNESEKSDLSSKEKRPAVEQEGVQNQPANMDLIGSTEGHGASIAAPQKEAPKSASVAGRAKQRFRRGDGQRKDALTARNTSTTSLVSSWSFTLSEKEIAKGAH